MLIAVGSVTLLAAVAGVPVCHVTVAPLGRLVAVMAVIKLLETEFGGLNIGNALPLLGLLPDQRLLEEPEKLKARLTFNKECVDKLTAFNKTIFDRVNSLPIAKNTLQVQIADFLKQNQSVYAAYALCQKLHHVAPHLNFGNWPIFVFPSCNNSTGIS